MPKNKKYWHILVILILGLAPLLWYKSEYIIAKGDIFPFWFNSLNTFFYDNFMWESVNAGQTSAWPQCNIFASIWYFLQMMHIAPNIIQIIFETFYFLGAGLAMYFLSSTIYRKEKIAPFIASIFYMFNFFMILRTLNFAVSWTLVFLPLMMAFYVRIINNLKSNQKTTKNVIGFAIISTFLMSFISINPPLIALSGIGFFIVFLYYFLSECNLRLKIIKNLGLLLGITLLINIWWIIPFLIYLYSSISGSAITEAVIDVTNWSWTHTRASFLNLFWLNGFWGWRTEYFPYIDSYSNSVMKFIVFIPMIIGFTGLLFKSKHRKINLYFGAVILFLMFLSKGLHPPLENINLLFYSYIPGFFLFREPFGKFYMILVIFLALLIGSSCNAIAEYIKNTKISRKDIISGVLMVFIIGSFFVSTYPLLTGDVITKETKQLPFSSYVRIPDYWYQASDFINSKEEDFRTMLTPNSDFYQMPYKWGYYGSDALTSRSIVKPIIQQPYGYIVNPNYEKMSILIYENMRANRTEGFTNLLSLLNVRYVLQRNDIWWDFGHREIISPQIIKSFLSNQRGIQFEKSFAELDFYEISPEYFLPHIYATPNPILIEGRTDEMLQFVSSDDFTVGDSALFLSSDLNQERIQFIEEYNNNVLFLDDNVPKITFKKINPTKYQVHVNASRPFFLVFSESYHPQWKAHIEDKPSEFNEIIASYDNVKVKEARHELKFTPGDISYLFAKPLPEEKHFLANGYANAWYIDPKEIDKDGDGEFAVTLYFWPQSLFYIGLIISGLTFVCCMGYLAYDWRNKKRKPNS